MNLGCLLRNDRYQGVLRNNMIENMCEIGYVFTHSERAGAKATCGVGIQSFISHGYSAIIEIDTNDRNIKSVDDDSIIYLWFICGWT